MESNNFHDRRRILPSAYYADGSNYNHERRTRAIAIGCCMRKWDPFNQLPSEEQESYIRRIERSCYNQACNIAGRENVPRNWENNNFLSLYSIITYRVQKNLLWSKNDPGSEYLIDLITKGGFDVRNIGKAKSNVLRPEKSKKIYEGIEMRKQQKIKKKYSTQHECFKCGGRKTTEVELQLRSLDEGSTLIITCEMDNCSNQWSLTS